MPDEFVDLEYDLHRVEASRGVLELAVRQVRAFARCLTASKSEADELVEDTLMLFLAEDRVLREPDTCFEQLLEVFRKVHARALSINASRGTPDREFAAFMQLPLAEREVAALVMEAGMSLSHAAGLLRLSLQETQGLLEKVQHKMGPNPLLERPFVPPVGNGYPLG